MHKVISDTCYVLRGSVVDVRICELQERPAQLLRNVRRAWLPGEKETLDDRTGAAVQPSRVFALGSKKKHDEDVGQR